MKTTVSCDHCNKQFRADSEKIPAHGRSITCPSCAKPFTIMKPDAFYQENHSPEVAAYILYRKHHKQSSDIQYDLRRIGRLELWLEQRDLTLATASRTVLDEFFDEIGARLSPGEVEGIQVTVSHLYEILVWEKVVDAPPYVHVQATPQPPPPDEAPPEPGAETAVEPEKAEPDSDDWEAASFPPLPAPSGPPARDPRRVWRILVLLVALSVLGGFGWMRQQQLDEAEARFQDALKQQKVLAEQARIKEEERMKAVEETRLEMARRIEAEKAQQSLERQKAQEKEQLQAALKARLKAEEEERLQSEEARQRVLDEARLLAERAVRQKEVDRRTELRAQADAEIARLRQEAEAKKQAEANKQADAVVRKKNRQEESWKKQCVTGDCQDGEGTFHFPNGDIYSGGWIRFKRSGYGVYTYADGSRYEGYWKDNQRSGKGSFVFTNGDRHSGRWENGKRVGPLSKHLKFAGYLAKLEREKELEAKRREVAVARKALEQARLAEEQGDQAALRDMTARGVTGCVKGDCEDGWGRYLYSSGDSYVGDWKNGQKDGKGTYTFKNGDQYGGYWRQDAKHGQGTYRFASGQIYQGGWYNGKKHGDGVIVFANGRKMVGRWENGERVR